MTLASAGTLDSLLALDPADIKRGLVAACREKIGPRDTPLVLAGAGELGRRTLRCLKKLGRTPLAFVDNNKSLLGKAIDGVPVLAPDDGAARFGKGATFVVTTFNTAKLWEQLESIGVQRVVSYGLLYAGFEGFLPYLNLDRPENLLRNADLVRKAFALMANETSRAEFVEQVRSRLMLNFAERPAGVPDEVRLSEYFPDDIYRPLLDEVLIDAGAFDGDTIRRFLKHRNGKFSRIYALEPDPVSHARLRERLDELGPDVAARIATRQVAASNKRGTIIFDATGTVASSSSSSSAAGSGLEVYADTFDNVLASVTPTLIKMDLEGGEPEALEGGRGVIGRASPVLAVTIYHRQDHLWRLPLLIKDIRNDYKFCLRAHAEAAWDASVYAVPPARLVQ